MMGSLSPCPNTTSRSQDLMKRYFMHYKTIICALCMSNFESRHPGAVIGKYTSSIMSLDLAKRHLVIRRSTSNCLDVLAILCL